MWKVLVLRSYSRHCVMLLILHSRSSKTNGLDLTLEKRDVSRLNQQIDKYWPPVGRVDNVYGDRHLICSCPSLADYTEAAK